MQPRRQPGFKKLSGLKWRWGCLFYLRLQPLNRVQRIQEIIPAPWPGSGASQKIVQMEDYWLTPFSSSAHKLPSRLRAANSNKRFHWCCFRRASCWPFVLFGAWYRLLRFFPVCQTYFVSALIHLWAFLEKTDRFFKFSQIYWDQTRRSIWRLPLKIPRDHIKSRWRHHILAGF